MAGSERVQCFGSTLWKWNVTPPCDHSERLQQHGLDVDGQLVKCTAQRKRLVVTLSV